MLAETNKNLIDKMKNGETLTGFYFSIGRKEFFCSTLYKNKTQQVASKILRKLQLPENPDTRKELLYYMENAFCEVKYVPANPSREICPEERYYYNIYGKNFSGFGSDNIEDKNTIVFEI